MNRKPLKKISKSWPQFSIHQYSFIPSLQSERGFAPDSFLVMIFINEPLLIFLVMERIEVLSRFVKSCIKTSGEDMGAVSENYDLVIQSLEQVTGIAKQVMEKVWGSNFKAYTLKPGKGVVDGINYVDNLNGARLKQSENLKTKENDDYKTKEIALVMEELQNLFQSKN